MAKVDGQGARQLLRTAFGERDLRAVSLEDLKTRFEAWIVRPEALSKWIAFSIRKRKIESQGLEELAAKLDEGAIPAAEVTDRFRMTYFEELMRAVFAQHAELAEFQGVSHEQLIARFRVLDDERILLARQEVALAHFQGLPVHDSERGEIGTVRREIKKKRRHLPIRQLLAQAGHAVQAIKPVFMMSPVSVAQYLQPGVLEFDLLLIDEASQVRPVDALGAIARARQMVVVGDDRQLPPTRFFDRLAGQDGDAPYADDFRAGDLESILGLCAAQNIPQRMLEWHYRSRHHSLIAVSNREFYDDRLYVVPSPMKARTRMGLRFRKVVDGVFDRGGSATNRVEAQAIADAVIEHARQLPDKSLGVGCFSVAQRDAILNELERRRREHPELEPFFSTDRDEPFFVKNLENIQGDERDVILISVGYGPDSSGYMSMNFGPLSNEGGERRLNVLITRARERCEVFSSITAHDIDLNRAKSRGAQAFKAFLSYAETGNLDVAVPTGGGYDSEFEREVATAVRALGYELDSQVGVAGFFIDLAVVDPDRPGRYLLGIECDGASYHSCRSARDRDRLRQLVLEDRGWIIHRIWSTDWFHRPEDQLRKVQAAIEAAKVEWAKREAQPQQNSNTADPPREVTPAIERGDTDETESHAAVVSEPYVEASFRVPSERDIHQLPAKRLAKIVTRIVDLEGPIHQEEVTRRVTSLLGLKRTGSRITDAVDMALYAAVDAGELLQEGPFFSVPDQEISIRDRQEVASSSLRKPEMLPPAEIRTAVQKVTAAHFGATADEVIFEVARLFGFRTTSSQLRAVIEQEIEQLCTQGLLQQRNGNLYADREATETPQEG